MQPNLFRRAKYYVIVALFGVSAITLRVSLLGVIRDEAYLGGLGPYLIVPALIGVLYGMYYLVSRLDKAEKYDRLVEITVGPATPMNHNRDHDSHRPLAQQ